LVDLCASLRQTERCILDADQGEKTDVAIAIAVREPKAVVREADVVGNSISKGKRLRGQFIVRTVAARLHGLGRNVLAPESRNDDVTTGAKTIYRKKWPRGLACNDFAFDGQITCCRFQCNRANSAINATRSERR
jgi:hypothetical protein